MIRRLIALLRHVGRLRWGTTVLIAGMIVIVVALVVYLLPYVYFDGYLTRRIARAVEESYPAYSIEMAGMHYRIWQNRLECDSVTLMKKDSTFSCGLARFTVSGIGRIQLLWGGGIAPDNLLSSVVDAKDILLSFPRSGYRLSCQRLQVSIPDSQIVIDTLEFKPFENDEQFFAARSFRKTRFHLIVPHCEVVGSPCLGLFEGKIHCARTARIHNAYLNILLNKDKQPPMKISRPQMPNEFLSSIRNTIQLDSTMFIDGKLEYSERYAVGAKPAMLTLDSVQILVEGSSNRVYHSDTVVVRARGRFIEAATINVFMSFPVATPEFSFRYSGSVGTMDLCKLNPFLEISESKRLKTGILHGASFEIDVVNGMASGAVRAAYKDLKIVAIENRTGSESGVFNTITSFIGNNIKLRTTNMPDKAGSLKIGNVKYVRTPDNAFFEFAWFALRNGIGDVVGF
jgi:hypothetical protein